MGQGLHSCATTTHAVRAALQQSKAPFKDLAARHGLNPKTVAKWSKRAFVQEVSMGPKAPRSTVLTAEEEEEAVVVGVDQGVSLAALDLFARVVTARAANLGGLDALAVDHARRKTGVAPGPLSIEHDQLVVQPLEGAVVTEIQEPAVDRLVGWKALGQHPPRTARAKHVEDRFDDLPHRPRPSSARPPRRRQARLQERPLRIRQIACVASEQLFAARRQRSEQQLGWPARRSSVPQSSRTHLRQPHLASVLEASSTGVLGMPCSSYAFSVVPAAIWP